MLFESKEPIYFQYDEHNYPIPLKISDTVYQLWKDRRIGKPHEFISYFNKQGYAYCYDKGVKSIIDTNGAVLFSANADFLSLPQNGIMGAGKKIFCPACDNYECALQAMGVGGDYAEVFYYIDFTGRNIFKDTFENITPFANGQATVEKNCKTYKINKNGKKLSASDNYVFVTDYKLGVCIVQNKDGQQALMDTSGKVISEWVSTFRQKEGDPVAYHFRKRQGAFKLYRP